LLCPLRTGPYRPGCSTVAVNSFEQTGTADLLITGWLRPIPPSVVGCRNVLQIAIFARMLCSRRPPDAASCRPYGCHGPLRTPLRCVRRIALLTLLDAPPAVLKKPDASRTPSNQSPAPGWGSSTLRAPRRRPRHRTRLPGLLSLPPRATIATPSSPMHCFGTG
jgi:hypothetical protein